MNWYVGQLQQELLQTCAASNSDDLKQLLEEAVGALYRHLMDKYDLSDVKDYMLPTYAVAMIAVENNKMKYYVLGDCSISYTHEGKMNSIRDERIKDFSADNRKKLKSFIQKTNSTDVPLSLYQETRMKANAENGYPIGMVTGKGLGQGIMGEIDLSHGDRVLIYSDGFLDYMNHDTLSLERFFNPQEIESEITSMYEYLGDTGEYKEKPRPKKMDDSTLLLLEVEE